MDNTRRDIVVGGGALAAGLVASAPPAVAQANPRYVFPPLAQPALRVVGTSDLYPVRRIYCVGRNYLEHIRELGNNEREPPFFFQKPLDSLVHEGGQVPYPSLTSNLHFEVELVVALKSGGRNIPQERALDHVYGYAIGIDLTRRDLQRTQQEMRRPWEIGKSFDFSAPCGPIHRVEQVGHVNDGLIRLSVNGQVRQDSDLKAMIWKTPEIIANLSRENELFAGDIIYTGTPHGVGPVRAGETMTCEIVKLGTASWRMTDRLA